MIACNLFFPQISILMRSETTAYCSRSKGRTSGIAHMIVIPNLFEIATFFVCFSLIDDIYTLFVT
jgi:hypothetical protein